MCDYRNPETLVAPIPISPSPEQLRIRDSRLGRGLPSADRTFRGRVFVESATVRTLLFIVRLIPAFRLCLVASLREELVEQVVFCARRRCHTCHILTHLLMSFSESDSQRIQDVCDRRSLAGCFSHVGTSDEITGRQPVTFGGDSSALTINRRSRAGGEHSPCQGALRHWATRFPRRQRRQSGHEESRRDGVGLPFRRRWQHHHRSRCGRSRPLSRQVVPTPPVR
ncbi:MAG: hypothetical protein J07HR59_00422 [Halorubrum sp. J07HR59]|nr:MAG: hypothetical protein J07HR59_00422 [Halorubrum sp. J07HR59]